jgi:hypothetical protein
MTANEDYDGHKWAAHRLESFPVSNARVSLAESFQEIGAALFGKDWNCEEIYSVELVDRPEIPPADVVFVGGQINETEYRSHLKNALALFTEVQCHDVAGAIVAGDGQAFARSFTLASSAASLEMLSAEEWAIAHEFGEKLADEKADAPEKLLDVSRAFCMHCESGDLETYYRPIGGGRTERMPPEHWAIDDVAGRCAAAGYDPASPYDVNATPTVNIFATEASLMLVVAKMRRTLGTRPEESARGRPALAFKVMPEFDRRMTSGEANLVVSAEARALAAWYSITYPVEQGHQPLKPKSIEPLIRSRIVAEKAARNSA